MLGESRRSRTPVGVAQNSFRGAKRGYKSRYPLENQPYYEYRPDRGSRGNISSRRDLENPRHTRYGQVSPQWPQRDRSPIRSPQQMNRTPRDFPREVPRNMVRDMPPRSPPRELSRGLPRDIAPRNVPRDIPPRNVPRNIPSRNGTRGMPSRNGTRGMPSRNGPRDMPSRNGPRDMLPRSPPRNLPRNLPPQNQANRDPPRRYERENFDREFDKRRTLREEQSPQRYSRGSPRESIQNNRRMHEPQQTFDGTRRFGDAYEKPTKWQNESDQLIRNGRHSFNERRTSRPFHEESATEFTKRTRSDLRRDTVHQQDRIPTFNGRPQRHVVRGRYPTGRR